MAHGAAPSRLERLWLSAFSGSLGALPDHLGQFRIASAYLRRRRPRPQQVLVQRMRGGIRAALDLADRTQGIAFLTRRYEPELVAYIVKRLPPSGVFVDVGAHVGLISLTVARNRPDVRVLAIEPHPANADAWSVNRDLNDLANAELSRCALADGIGRVAFHEERDSAAGHLSATGTSTVDATTLDEFASGQGLGHIDVLKIDTEGGELAVLDGAAELLSRGALSTIVCELNSEHLARQGRHPDEIVARLRGAGFEQVPLRVPRSPLHRPDARPPAIVDVAFERASARDPRSGS